MELEAAATIALCLAVGVLAVIASDIAARWLPLPSVVLEILGGILIGPAVLGIAHDNTIVSAFSELGLTVLMFLAGYEVQPSKLAGPPLRSAVVGWLTSLAVGLGVGLLLVHTLRHEDGLSSGVLLGLLFTTTALGTVLPILRDSGVLDSAFGDFVLSAGAVGEFGPILAIAVLLSSDSIVHTLVVLVVFGGIAATVLVLAHRRRSARVARLLSHTLETSGQLGVRMAMLLILVLAWAAGHLGLDVLLGAFTAGLVVRLYFSAADDADAPGRAETMQRETVARLEGIGFGFLVPIFFVVSGIRFDLDALLAEPAALMLVPASLVLFLLVRGGGAYGSLHGALAGRERVAAAVYTATALPLVVVLTGLGVEDKELTPATAAALVGAGMLSVLLFPLMATRIRGVTGPVSPEGWQSDSDAL